MKVQLLMTFVLAASCGVAYGAGVPSFASRNNAIIRVATNQDLNELKKTVEEAKSFALEHGKQKQFENALNAAIKNQQEIFDLQTFPLQQEIDAKRKKKDEIVNYLGKELDMMPRRSIWMSPSTKEETPAG